MLEGSAIEPTASKWYEWGVIALFPRICPKDGGRSEIDSVVYKKLWSQFAENDISMFSLVTRAKSEITSQFCSDLR